MARNNVRIHLLLITGLLATAAQPALGESTHLLDRLIKRVGQWQSSMPEVRQSATQAAKGALNGGRIFAVGPQPGFSTEAKGRAGGLMMLQRGVPEDANLTRNDTILAAMVGYESGQARKKLSGLIDRAGQANAQVVVFADGQRKKMSLPSHVRLLPGKPTDDASPTATISNVIGMWAWTGAFIDACVQQGSMPCVYQSHLLPGGRDRSRMLKQRFDGRFHKQTNVRPEDAAKLGGRFLTTVKKSLRAMTDQQWKTFQRASRLLKQTRRQGHGVQVFARGHLFPEALADPTMPEGWSASRKAAQLKPEQAAIVLEYQAFPWKLIGKITDKPRVCIVTSSQSSLPAFTSNDRRIYIDPHWPIHDGAVALKGYDVTVLPSSGLLDATVYWQLVELSQPEHSGGE